MLNSLFIDSINGLSSQLETNLMHLFNSSTKKISEKIQSLTIQLLHFKAQFYKQISSLIKQTSSNSFQNKPSQTQTIKLLNQQLQSQIKNSSQQLFKYRLHQLLKKKLIKKKRTSIIDLSMTQSNCSQQQITNLQRSVVMIEKDLGIDNQEDQLQKLSTSTIRNNKSYFSQIHSTPISNYSEHNNSVISQTQYFTINNSSHFDNFSKFKENKHENTKDVKIPQEKSQMNNVVKKSGLGKKKKVSLKSEAKEGILDNLLEQTYNLCLKK